jgi:hypothetical protein
MMLINPRTISLFVVREGCEARDFHDDDALASASMQ